jgi:hypothetical protein
MARQSSTALYQRSAAVAEVIVINAIWPCGLGMFGAGLVTQNTELALQGLAVFLATYFYTLVRLYQARSVDDHEKSSDPIRSASGYQPSEPAP